MLNAVNLDTNIAILDGGHDCVHEARAFSNYLRIWLGGKAIKQVVQPFCDLVGKELGRRYVPLFALNDQKMGCPFGHNITKVFGGLTLAVEDCICVAIDKLGR